MANLNDERNGQGNTPDPGFNNIRNSAMDKREKKRTLHSYTFLAIIALTALLVITLLITAIGGIIANVANKGPGENTDEPGLDKKVVWTEITLGDADAKHGSLVLVNATHEYTFPATDDHLQKIYDVRAQHSTTLYQLGLSTYMERTALGAMDQMLADFSAATGKTNVLVRYAYRDKADQEMYGSEPVGFSDFHTGSGCDLKYLSDGKQYDLTADPTYAWITDNAAKYGFVIRYPEAKAEITGVSDYESYYRYVGPAHATYMTEKELCLEEYLEVVKEYTNKKPLKITGADGNNYEVYYVEIKGNTTVKVPENFTYTLSGTNDGGVIVTVNRSEAAAPAESDTTETETAAIPAA